MDLKTYNWRDLKVEFMASGYYCAQDFFIEKFGKYTPTMRRNVQGWTREKKMVLARAYRKALEKIAKDKEDLMLKLAGALDSELVRLVGQLTATPLVDADEFTTIWRLVRTECGLPTSIAKQETVDHTALEIAKDSLNKKLDELTKSNIAKGKKRTVKKRPATQKKPKR